MPSIQWWPSMPNYSFVSLFHFIILSFLVHLTKTRDRLCAWFVGYAVCTSTFNHYWCNHYVTQWSVMYPIFLKTKSSWQFIMMTSSNGNIFRVTGHLCGESTGPRWIPRIKASDAELWCFLSSASEQTPSKHSRAGDLRRYCVHYEVIVMMAQ